MSRSIHDSKRSLRVSPHTCFAVCALTFGLLLSAPAFAESEYDPPDSGHPVRIAGYMLHPVGVVFDYLILRPAWWVGSYQPFRTLFGRED